MAKKEALPGTACEDCGQVPVLRYQEYNFWWMEGIDMEIGDLPAESMVELYPTFIMFTCKEGWKTAVPMDHIRFMNIKEPTTLAKGKAPATACDGCGESRVLRFKEFNFFWIEGIEMELADLPEDSVVEVHPTFISVSCKDGWKTVIPMDCIRFMNLKGQF